MGIFDFFKSSTLKNRKIKPVVLLVLDGWGLAPPSPGNAIMQAHKPNVDYLTQNYPSSTLIASGEAVGLPANEVGNTEVGHLTMGAGRVIFQDLKRINLAIEDKSFFINPAFLQAANQAKKNNTKLHIMGVFGSGRVHSSKDHLFALLEFCRNENIPRVFLHIFTDGRDSPPKEAIDVIGELEEKLKTVSNAKIATISGRYFAMDRDGRWERTKKAYDAMVLGKGDNALSVKDALKTSYEKQITDEFVEPTVIFENGKPVSTIEDGDSVIFFNFRIDRAKQLTQAFVLPDFGTFVPPKENESKPEKALIKPEFERDLIIKNLLFVTMTVYHEALPVSAVAFPTQAVSDSLAEILSNRGLQQLHMAESEKERFVTYYFDGMREARFTGENVSIVPSSKVATYDQHPQMSVFNIVGEFKKNLDKDIYNFFVINFANADMVGHTGNVPKAVEAIVHLDKAIGEVVKVCLAADGVLIITADHGNAEEMLSLPTTSFFFTTDKGSTNTDHSNNPVPVILVGNKFPKNFVKLRRGYLSDIAPTILAIMNIDKPPAMTGVSLIEK